MDISNAMQTWNPPVKMSVTSGCLPSVALTTGSIQYYYPWDTYPLQTSYVYVAQPPQFCFGDVHVFPCPHCEKCKCGAATVKRQKVK